MNREKIMDSSAVVGSTVSFAQIPWIKTGMKERLEGLLSGPKK